MLAEFLKPSLASIDHDTKCLNRATYNSYSSIIDATSFALCAGQDENVAVGSGKKFEVKGGEEDAPIRHGLRIVFCWERGRLAMLKVSEG